MGRIGSIKRSWTGQHNPDWSEDPWGKVAISRLHGGAPVAKGKYKSSEIYCSPTDPKLQQEYQDYLKMRLEEIYREREGK